MTKYEALQTAVETGLEHHALTKGANADSARSYVESFVTALADYLGAPEGRVYHHAVDSDGVDAMPISDALQLGTDGVWRVGVAVQFDAGDRVVVESGELSFLTHNGIVSDVSFAGTLIDGRSFTQAFDSFTGGLTAAATRGLRGTAAGGRKRTLQQKAITPADERNIARQAEEQEAMQHRRDGTQRA